MLDGLMQFAADVARHDLRLSDRELEAFATHQLDQDGELELPASLHFPSVRACRREHAQRHVAYEFLRKPRLDHARGQTLAVLACKRRGVDPDRDRKTRL